MHTHLPLWPCCSILTAGVSRRKTSPTRTSETGDGPIPHPKWHLPADRYFDPDPTQRRIARELYETVAGLPLICPHGRVDPRLFADEGATFGTPVDLLIIPDHYVFRLLYSQGIPLEALGIPRADGEPVAASLIELQPLLDGSLAAELLFAAELGPAESRVYRVMPAVPEGPPLPALRRLQNTWLDVRLSRETGFVCLTFEGREIGDGTFLQPFITYRSRNRLQTWPASGYTFDDLAGEAWAGLTRARMRTQIPMETPSGPVTTALQYTFTLFDHLPYLLLDVAVDYASTAPAPSCCSYPPCLSCSWSSRSPWACGTPAAASSTSSPASSSPSRSTSSETLPSPSPSWPAGHTSSTR